MAVPSLDALLDTMLGVHGFDLLVKGKSVAKVDWTGGHAARDKLKSCAAKRARKSSEKTAPFRPIRVTTKNINRGSKCSQRACATE